MKAVIMESAPWVGTMLAFPVGNELLIDHLLLALKQQGVRGGSGWLDSVGPFLSGAWRIVDYAAVCRVVRWS